jgi:hypothetical protein
MGALDQQSKRADKLRRRNQSTSFEYLIRIPRLNASFEFVLKYPGIPALSKFRDPLIDLLQSCAAGDLVDIALG